MGINVARRQSDHTDDVMFLTTKNSIMNKVISHIHYIYIASPLLKTKLGCNIYFNSSQYYRTERKDKYV
jgi:hypothetical protein